MKGDAYLELQQAAEKMHTALLELLDVTSPHVAPFSVYQDAQAAVAAYGQWLDERQSEEEVVRRLNATGGTSYIEMELP